MNCTTKECSTRAQWYPVLRLFAKGYQYSKPFKVIIAVPVCAQCANKLWAENIINDQIWQKLLEIFLATGLKEPQRDNAQIEFVEIDKAGDVFKIAVDDPV